MKHERDREDVIERYRRYLHAEIRAGRITLDELRALDGKTLGCFCAPKACHGDVLARAVAWAMTQPHTAGATPAERLRLKPTSPRVGEDRARPSVGAASLLAGGRDANSYEKTRT